MILVFAGLLRSNRLVSRGRRARTIDHEGGRIAGREGLPTGLIQHRIQSLPFGNAGGLVGGSRASAIRHRDGPPRASESQMWAAAAAVGIRLRLPMVVSSVALIASRVGHATFPP